jgi:hypothetical protein
VGLDKLLPLVEDSNQKGQQKDQSFHTDSLMPGFSAVRPFEQSQSVLVLWNGFRAIKILEELMEDRIEATEFVRSLHTARRLSDTQWQSVEPRVWELLVHKEFKARKLPDFEAVRVPVAVSCKIVMDTRCPHAGDSWSGRKRAYRGHLYGYRRDIKERTNLGLSLTGKDEFATVDLTDRDLSPIVGWAQKGQIKLFRRISR